MLGGFPPCSVLRGAAVPPAAPLFRGPSVIQCGVSLQSCGPRHHPAEGAAPPSSTSLPLSLLPPTPEQPDPCPGAGGPPPCM